MSVIPFKDLKIGMRVRITFIQTRENSLATVIKTGSVPLVRVDERTRNLGWGDDNSWWVYPHECTIETIDEDTNILLENYFVMLFDAGAPNVSIEQDLRNILNEGP